MGELEVVAKKALALHQSYPDQFRLAQTYGILANLALVKSACSEALQFAQQALSLIASTESDTSNSVVVHSNGTLEVRTLKNFSQVDELS
jgi:hypothetical protein